MFDRVAKTKTKSKVKRKASGTSRRPRKNYLAPARLQAIFAALDELFPQATCALHHRDAFQLLIATILSAQCTDETVNKVTPGLFAHYPTPRDLASAGLEALQAEIRPTGFFRNKAKSISGASKRLVEHYSGEVPKTMEDLLSLPGVARKTANVVLGTAFGIPSGVVVDTHVFRITRRLKLTQASTPEKVELDLMKVIPQDRWISFAHQVIWFGRKICFARKPLCADCPLERLCDAPDKTV